MTPVEAAEHALALALAEAQEAATKPNGQRLKAAAKLEQAREELVRARAAERGKR